MLGPRYLPNLKWSLGCHAVLSQNTSHSNHSNSRQCWTLCRTQVFSKVLFKCWPCFCLLSQSMSFDACKLIQASSWEGNQGLVYHLVNGEGRFGKKGDNKSFLQSVKDFLDGFAGIPWCIKLLVVDRFLHYSVSPIEGAQCIEDGVWIIIDIVDLCPNSVSPSLFVLMRDSLIECIKDSLADILLGVPNYF